jgi:PmbA protein
MPDLDDWCRRAVDAASGHEAVEAYVEESRRTDIRVRDGEIDSLTFAGSSGLGVRVIVDGSVGYAYAADPDLTEIPALVARAREGAAFAQPDDANVLPLLEPVDPMPGIYREAQLDVPMERKVALALDLERAAVAAEPSVRKVESAGYGESVGRVAVASTNGVPVEYPSTNCWAWASSLAESNGETQTGYAFRLAYLIDELDWRGAAEEAAERAARLLGGVKPPTRRVPVILDPVAAASFLSVLAGTLSADAVQKGRSPLGPLLGEPVASELVSLIDDGRREDGPAAGPFDDEGVATGRTALIERGVLRAFLHNSFTAAKAGTSSTGNASRAGYRSVPGVGPTNLFVEAGATSLGDLLGMAEGGVYVQDVTGLHSGANPVSGEFSVGATGLRIGGGELGQPLREMTIASTLLDMLKAVAAVGSELRFFPFGGGLGSPTLLLGEMTVAGT